MTNPLGFDDLQALLHRRLAPLPDHRQQGPNTSYAITDAALRAFGIFFTQSPSLLDDQRHLQQAQGHHNASTLCGVEQLPWNNPLRNLLAPLIPSQLDGVDLEVFARLAHPGALDNWRVLAHQLLGALDGTQDHSSQAIHCQNCLRRQRAHGPTLSYPSAMTPVIVCPGRSEVIALPPACIMPQDGPDKQDCERVAGKRCLDKHATQVAPYGIPLLGDDLYRNQPLCQLALHQGLHFLLGCKPDSHATLSKRLAFWQAHEAIQALATRRWGGRFTPVTRQRYLNEVFLQGGKGALVVHGLALTSVNAKTGEPLQHNSCITKHRLRTANVAEVAQAGRGRWKIENENHNVRKTKGYHLEQNLGHGKKYLAAFRLSRNLLALLFHTVLEWGDDKQALRRQVLARRQTFFDDIRALTRYMVFDSWHHVMDFMLRGLKLEAKLDTG